MQTMRVTEEVDHNPKNSIISHSII